LEELQNKSKSINHTSLKPNIQNSTTITTNTKVAKYQHISIEGNENRFQLASFITIVSGSTFESNKVQFDPFRRS